MPKMMCLVRLSLYLNDLLKRRTLISYRGKLATATCVLAAATSANAFATPSNSSSLSDLNIEQPLVLSYLAAIDPGAESKANDAASSFTFGGSACWVCHKRANAADILVTKTAFWLPYIYWQMRESAPKRRIILDPLTLQVDAAGQLVFQSGLEGRLAPFRSVFIAYTSPVLGLNGEDAGVYSRGSWLSALITCTPFTTTASDTAWSTYKDSTTDRASRLLRQVVHREKWDKLVTTTANKVGDRDGAVRSAALRALNACEGKPVPSVAEIASSYHSILGESPTARNDELDLALFNAEIVFREKRSESLIQLYTDSDLQRALLKQAVAEEAGIRKQNQMQTLMVIAQVGTLGASSAVVAAGNLALIQGWNKLNAAAGAQSASFSQVEAQQVLLTADLAGKRQGISASNVAELRKKLLAIAIRTEQ